MDVRAMDFPEGSFDAVIDKGTFDSVIVNYSTYCSVAKDLTQMQIKCLHKFIGY